LLLAFFPWLALLLWSLIAGIKHLLQTKSASPATTFLFSWSAFCIFFFSTSHSKLPGYILPAIPAVGLLLCHSVLVLGSLHRKLLFASLFSFAGAALVVLVLLSGTHIPARPNIAMAISIGIPILAVVVFTNGVLGWAFFGKGGAQHEAWLSAISPLPVVLVLLASGNTLHAVDVTQFTAKSTASQIQTMTIPSEKLFLLSPERRDWQYAFNFYLHCEIKIWDHDSTAEAYVLSGRPRRCSSIISQGLNCSETILDTPAGRWWVLHVSPVPTARQAP
jgi:hypothetical protein